eukprot:6981231-Alexandrium_andersonii.AAC.1
MELVSRVQGNPPAVREHPRAVVLTPCSAGDQPDRCKKLRGFQGGRRTVAQVVSATRVCASRHELGEKCLDGDFQSGRDCETQRVVQCPPLPHPQSLQVNGRKRRPGQNFWRGRGLREHVHALT